MAKKIIRYLALVILIVFIFALGVNNDNSGVYADAHQLNGASVGWFAPNGVLILFLSVLITIFYTLYLIIRTRQES